MRVQIAKIIYWTATAIALLLTVGTVYFVVVGLLGFHGYTRETAALESLVLIPATLIWLFGWACRRLLAGGRRRV